jgi:molybdate transport system substrate-binding protein
MKSFLLKLCTAALLGTCAAAANVQAADLHVMSSGGFTAAYKLLGPSSRRRPAIRSIPRSARRWASRRRPFRTAFERGEPADVVIMVGYALDDLIKQGKVIPGSRVELADSRIGMAVRDGAPKPDIGSEAMRSRNLAACEIDRLLGQRERRLYRARVFKRLGIEDQVKAKAKMIPKIPVASVVATVITKWDSSR